MVALFGKHLMDWLGAFLVALALPLLVGAAISERVRASAWLRVGALLVGLGTVIFLIHQLW